MESELGLMLLHVRRDQLVLSGTFYRGESGPRFIKGGADGPETIGGRLFERLATGGDSFALKDKKSGNGAMFVQVRRRSFNDLRNILRLQCAPGIWRSAEEFHRHEEQSLANEFTGIANDTERVFFSSSSWENLFVIHEHAVDGGKFAIQGLQFNFCAHRKNLCELQFLHDRK